MANNNNVSPFLSDVENYIQDEVLPLSRKWLVVYQFGDPHVLPKGRGESFTATRYNRLPLPFQPLSEGVPQPGETLTLSQVTVAVLQWGDRVNITDRAEIAIKHPLLDQAQEKIALQSAETFERNTFNSILGFPQINYVNSRGSRGALLAGDVLNTSELVRAYAQLATIGVPRYNGDEQTDIKVEANAGGAKASTNPRQNPHYTAVCHTFVESDLKRDSTFTLAASYSDINRLYNNEFGEWNGIRFCSSNLVPYWDGFATLGGTAGTAGTLATNTYFVIITASDTYSQYESQVYAVSSGISVTGPTGSVSVVLPSNPGFTYSAYIGTTSSPTNLALSASGVTQGVLTGQATQMAGGQTVILTGLGIAQVPPAAPAVGLRVFPTFIFGRGAYGQVMLDDIKISVLTEADKSDPMNQLRMISWKVQYATLLQNTTFAMRIESVSSFNSTFG